MSIRSALLIIITCLVLTPLLAQKKFINPDYKLNKEKLSLCLVPIYTEYDSMNDSLLYKFFGNNNFENLVLTKPSENRKIIDNDGELAALLTTISKKEYKKKELRQYPNLNTLLTPLDLTYIRDRLDGADLILLPRAFRISGTTYFTFGSSSFRMYDLNTGEFIFEFRNQLNVNVGIEKAAKNLTQILIGMTYEDFKADFVLKHNIH